jgi:hypothetical protein
MAGELDTKVFLTSSLQRLIDWSKAADMRASLVLPLSTAMLGTLAILAAPPVSWSLAGAIAGAFAAVLLLLSILFVAFASFPRTSGPKGSLIYFGGIAARDVDQYTKAVKDLKDSAYILDLARQCHRNAQITERKYLWVKRAMVCLFLSAMPWTVALFILYTRRQ